MTWNYINAFNGKVVGIQGGKGGMLVCQDKNGSDNQMWKFEDGMVVSKTGLVADIPHSRVEEGVQVTV